MSLSAETMQELAGEIEHLLLMQQWIAARIKRIQWVLDLEKLVLPAAESEAK